MSRPISNTAITTAYSGMNVDQRRALDKSAAEDLEKVGASLDNGQRMAISAKANPRPHDGLISPARETGSGSTVRVKTTEPKPPAVPSLAGSAELNAVQGARFAVENSIHRRHRQEADKAPSHHGGVRAGIPLGPWSAALSDRGLSFPKRLFPLLYEYPKDTFVYRAQTVLLDDLGSMKQYLSFKPGRDLPAEKRVATVKKLVATEGWEAVGRRQLQALSTDGNERLTIPASEDLSEAFVTGRRHQGAVLADGERIRITAALQPDPDKDPLLSLRRHVFTPGHGEDASWFVGPGEAALLVDPDAAKANFYVIVREAGDDVYLKITDGDKFARMRTFAEVDDPKSRDQLLYQEMLGLEAKGVLVRDKTMPLVARFTEVVRDIHLHRSHLSGRGGWDTATGQELRSRFDHAFDELEAQLSDPRVSHALRYAQEVLPRAEPIDQAQKYPGLEERLTDALSKLAS